jgi:hypothetical protein
MRIVETVRHARGQYAALSHCWGSSTTLTTTQATLDDRVDAVSYDELPKTFQDAVQVCRALGLKFLWIDSLCIIQDDPEDWANEASLMAAVYHNAYLTISATSSRSSNEGLFRRSVVHNLTGQLDDGTIYQFVFRQKFDHNWQVFDHSPNTPESSHTHTRDQFPLSSRAWGLQERLLSHRVLHFGPGELSFECISRAYCECKGNHLLADTLRAPKLALVNLRTPKNTDRRRLWRNMVELYSPLQLTFSKDKLPAISGLAQRFAKSGDQYLAGLWSRTKDSSTGGYDTLIEDLQWCIRHGSKRARPAWRAPSWSWASVDGQVSFHGGTADWEFSNVLQHPDVLCTPAVEHIECDVNPKDQQAGVYGELLSGSLHLCGRYSTVSWKRVRKHSSSNLLTDYVQFENGLEVEFQLDYLPEGQQIDDYLPGEVYEGQETSQGGTTREIVCLLLSLQTRKMKPWRVKRYSLVLRRLDPGVHLFERIGLLAEPDRWYAHLTDLVDDKLLWPQAPEELGII